MNKKIFASALFAIAAFASAGASAQITYTNSVADTAQTNNAVVAPGGNSVRANDISITLGTDGDAPAGKDIIIRLPKGLNFDGAPKYKVKQATTGVGLTLKDGSEFGDPTLDSPGISLADANGDGGDDRALVTVAAASKAGDTLTISINLTADSTVTKGAKKVSVIVNNGLAVTTDVVEVVVGLEEPVFSATGTKLSTIDQKAQTATVSTAKAIITIPKGTKGGTLVTLTPQANLKFANGTNATTLTSTLSYTIHTPVAFDPINSSSVLTASTSGTASISLVVTGTSTYTLPDDVQLQLTMSAVQTTLSTTTGARGFDVSGAVTGKMFVVDVKKNGSTAALATGAKLTKLVKGSSSAQTLPSITITENFVGDTVSVGGTATITLTPSTGLTLTATTPTLNAGWSWGSPTLNATTGVLTLVVLHDSGSSTKTLTISGLTAKAKSTASGDLSVTVAGSKSTAPPKDVLAVATAVDLGSVTITGPTTKAKTGPGGASVVSSIKLKEGTYGALSTAAKTDVQDAYFRVTPSNATISNISITFSNYASGATPSISTCLPETGSTTGAYLCEVTAESTAVTAGTSTITAAVTYKAKSTAPIGGTVVMTFDGNSGVSGAVTVADVLNTTTSKADGQIPDLVPGALDAKNLAKVVITEAFTGAVTNTLSTFRLVAPTGVAFQDAATISASSTSIGTVTITATFAPNDTLVINNNSTATISFTPKAVIASGASGYLSFNLVDGNIDGKKGANITAATLKLAYADGTLGDVDAGDAADVNVDYTVSNTVDGGLAPYTAKSSASAIASVKVVGDVVTVTGLSVGASTITVTDELGDTADYVVTVTAGATQPDQAKPTKTLDGSDSSATFTGGASTDGGDSYTDAITTADDVTIIATINVDIADQGSAGAIHALVLSPVGFLTLESDGSWVPWDGTIAGIATYSEEDSLADTYSVPLYSGTIAATGKWRFAVAYTTEDGKLVYSTNVAQVTVSAE